VKICYRSWSLKMTRKCRVSLRKHSAMASWKVAIMRDGPQQDADRCEMIAATGRFGKLGWGQFV
jgi:hypothetical protein